jgi:hypothetical protein
MAINSPTVQFESQKPEVWTDGQPEDILSSMEIAVLRLYLDCFSLESLLNAGNWITIFSRLQATEISSPSRHPHFDNIETKLVWS